MDKMNERRNRPSADESGSIESLVSRHCSHIQKPYTLEEICNQVDGCEYNAELMLQHLLLWVSANDRTERR